MAEQARQVETLGRYAPPAWLKARARSRSPLYIRFGDLPEGGRSSTGRREWIAVGLPGMVRGIEGDREAGVSVFRGHRGADGALMVDVCESVGLAACLREMLRQERPAHLATGREVGTGPMGEPLLADVEMEPVPEDTRVEGSGEWESEAKALMFGLRLREFCEALFGEGG